MGVDRSCSISAAEISKCPAAAAMSPCVVIDSRSGNDSVGQTVCGAASVLFGLGQKWVRQKALPKANVAMAMRASMGICLERV
jgi:hypothetical protein